MIEYAFFYDALITQRVASVYIKGNEKKLLPSSWQKAYYNLIGNYFKTLLLENNTLLNYKQSKFFFSDTAVASLFFLFSIFWKNVC